MHLDERELPPQAVIDGTIETQPMLSPPEMEAKLHGLRGHIERADGWASNQFRMFPNMDMISINFGASLVVQFSITISWHRK